MRTLITGILGLALIGGTLLAEEAANEVKKDTEKQKIKILCPVSGKAVNKDVTAAYKKGQVSFCCENCAAAFAKDSTKFAAKANMQLVATKQFIQKACPISGRAANKDVLAKVGDLKVQMCCKNCLGKVDKASKDDKIKLVFNDKSFAKAFELKKEGKKEAKKETKKDAA